MNSDIDEIVLKAKVGDPLAEEQILKMYEKPIQNISKKYFVIGAELEDIYQNGAIGLLNAIRSYDFSKNLSFENFAFMNIKNSIYNFLTSMNRKKHGPMRDYVSIDKKIYEYNPNSNRTLEDILYLPSDKYNPENYILNQETIKMIYRNLHKDLSSLEFKILKMRLNGESYKKISMTLNITPKSIDNAVQRFKKKIKNILEKQEE